MNIEDPDLSGINDKGGCPNCHYLSKRHKTRLFRRPGRDSTSVESSLQIGPFLQNKPNCKTEYRTQKTEDRIQNTENRRQSTGCLTAPIGDFFSVAEITCSKAAPGSFFGAIGAIAHGSLFPTILFSGCGRRLLTACTYYENHG